MDAKTAEQSRLSFEAWRPNWRVELLVAPPLITPARQFIYPVQIAGEEDALARGALQLLVHPAGGGTFLATCALGFVSAAMPSGLLACPNPEDLCAIAGGYAYVINTMHPERCTFLSLRPVTEVRTRAAHGLLLFAGFHKLLAWGAGGQAWESARLSWEGIRLADGGSDETGQDGIGEGEVGGFGWNMPSDKEVPFAVDLKTGQHRGGGF